MVLSNGASPSVGWASIGRADFSITIMLAWGFWSLAHSLLHCLGGGGEESRGNWNFSWSGGICGQIIFWASNFSAIELPRRHLSLFACISLCRCLPFAFIYSFEMTPLIFNLYQNLEAWYLFCRSAAHLFSLRPLAGGWRAWCPRGVLPSTFVLVTGGQIKACRLPVRR